MGIYIKETEPGYGRLKEELEWVRTSRYVIHFTYKCFFNIMTEYLPTRDMLRGITPFGALPAFVVLLLVIPLVGILKAQKSGKAKLFLSVQPVDYRISSKANLG